MKETCSTANTRCRTDRIGARFALVILAGTFFTGMHRCHGANTYFFDDFNSYASDADVTAAGWTILDTPEATEVGSTWTITNPGGRANPMTLRGGASSGSFLISDSDAGSGDNPTDSGASHDLVTPSFATLGATSVWLHANVSAVLNNNGSAIFDVEVSTTGGTVWLPVFTRVAPGRGLEQLAITRNPTVTNADGFVGRLDVDLTPLSSDFNDVQVRFRHFEPNDDWFIAIDDVLIDDMPPTSGGPDVIMPLQDFSGGSFGLMSVTGLNAGTDDSWHLTDKGARYMAGVPLERNVNRINHPNLGTDFAILESQADPDPAQDEYLHTPAFDLSDYSDVFLHWKSETIPQGNLQEVLVSFDGGATFEPTAVFDYFGGGLIRAGEDPWYAERIVAVPEAARRDNVQFAFHFAGQNGWWWAVDDVMVTGVLDPVIPEPSALLLALVGLACAAGVRRR